MAEGRGEALPNTQHLTPNTPMEDPRHHLIRVAKLAYDPMTRGSKPAASAILLPLKLRPPKRSTSTPPPDP